MKYSRLIFGQFLILVGLLLSTAIQAVPANDPELRPVTEATTNADCLECHGVEGFAVPRGVGEGRKRSIHVKPAVFADSVHGEERCVACHTDIEQMPHQKDVERAVDCVQCHDKQKTDINKEVAENEKHYLASIHAQPKKDDPNSVNATCWDCHGTHNVFPMDAAEAQTYRLSISDTCSRCHEKQLNEYTQSVHGAAVKRYGNLEAAVCSDCHTAHKIESPEEDPVKLLITQNCGSCHEEQYESYSDTYHGQVHRLGYTHTAKCYDCHDYHNVLKIDDEKSTVHLNNLLETCQKCHENATEGFVTFYPHGTTHDFDRYPEIWITSKFMIGLLIGVFLFFWIHAIFWFYREYKERKTGHAEVRLDENGDPAERQKHVRRFSGIWRLAHLILAIAVMVLVLTGTAVLYAESFWAPTAMMLLGGPEIAAIIHRVAAVTFAFIFFGHLILIFYNIFIKGRGKFRWFGPDSLLPRWKDFSDFWGMCKWFVGKGPRPRFDRWTYWEKFDYWAPFWGMFIIGCSGVILWQPDFFASFLPGWVFNVATIVHAEEAFLAAVFLFSVHYFNSHFRPDKFPQDTIMFTGSMTLEEFKEERPVEYERLVEEGRLEEFLVGAPSPRMARYSEILGFFLIAVGVILLFLVLVGFIQTEF